LPVNIFLLDENHPDVSKGGMENIIDILKAKHVSLIEEQTLIDSLIEVDDPETRRKIEYREAGYPTIKDEFWTARQRQANSIHEISYRACFKPQLPNYFINLFTKELDVVYDPFSGRGTTAVEAALCNRNVIANDVNPLSIILTRPRIHIPELNEIKSRIEAISYFHDKKADIDLSMFYHPDTESEIVSLRDYLIEKKASGTEDSIDMWIRMVATNKLTGHSEHFFSVYTLPPNQACSQEKQIELNKKSGKTPAYKSTKNIILKKSLELQKDITPQLRKTLNRIGEKALYLNADASKTYHIPDGSVSLVVTSPPFLDVIDYAGDNWLRCWFNNINIADVQRNITVTNKIEKWDAYMQSVFHELYRVIKPDGYVAFEVGEVRNGKIKLEDNIVPVCRKAGFEVVAVIINEQIFTKTSNIWGVSNNAKGTNTNRIILMRKAQS